jgi:hypothetical protein
MKNSLVKFKSNAPSVKKSKVTIYNKQGYEIIDVPQKKNKTPKFLIPSLLILIGLLLSVVLFNQLNNYTHTENEEVLVENTQKPPQDSSSENIQESLTPARVGPYVPEPHECSSYGLIINKGTNEIDGRVNFWIDVQDSKTGVVDRINNQDESMHSLFEVGYTEMCDYK